MSHPCVALGDSVPQGESHTTFSVDGDRQIIAGLRKLLEQTQVALEHGKDQLNAACQTHDKECQEIQQTREGLQTGVGVLDGCHPDHTCKQTDRVRSPQGLQCERQHDHADLKAELDFGHQKLSHPWTCLQTGRDELKSDRKDLADSQDELKRERKWLQEERLEFERVRSQAELDLSESRDRLKRERAQLQEERQRFEGAQIKFALANVKIGLSVAKRARQLDNDRLEMDQKRQELDRRLRQLAEEDGWSFGDEDEADAEAEPARRRGT
jgi:hypothetical protein